MVDANMFYVFISNPQNEQEICCLFIGSWHSGWQVFGARTGSLFKILVASGDRAPIRQPPCRFTKVAQGCALRKIEGGPVLGSCKIKGTQHMICMQNLRFSSCPRAKVKRQGPPVSARAQRCCHKAGFHCIKQSWNKSWNEVQPLRFSKATKSVHFTVNSLQHGHLV